MEIGFEEFSIWIRHATHRSLLLSRTFEDWSQTSKYKFWRGTFVDVFTLQYEAIEPLDEFEDRHLWRPIRIQICGQFTRSFHYSTARVSFGLGRHQFGNCDGHIDTCHQSDWSLVARTVQSEHSQAEQIDTVEEVEGLFKLVLQLLQRLAWIVRSVDKLSQP